MTSTNKPHRLCDCAEYMEATRGPGAELKCKGAFFTSDGNFEFPDIDTSTYPGCIMACENYLPESGEEVVFLQSIKMGLPQN